MIVNASPWAVNAFFVCASLVALAVGFMIIRYTLWRD